MAIMDYGAIAFKNGKLISTQMFTPMKDTVGWEDTEEDVFENLYTYKDEPINFKDHFFVYIGDEEVTLAFYKEYMCRVSGSLMEPHRFYKETINFGFNNFHWRKWTDFIKGEKVTVRKRNGYRVFKWKYKGDKYKVYFGYGVDFNYYKKYRIVNYYRSPEYYFNWIKRSIKNFFEDVPF